MNLVHHYLSYAKLNLSLRVFSPRSDGYHPIFSFFQTINFYDVLRFSRLEGETGFSLRVNHPLLKVVDDNLLTRVFMTLKDRIPFGIEIVLDKRIPLGAGLGGGSSNVAVFLQYLCQEGVLTQEELPSLGLRFGADVPFFLTGGLCQVEGIGEIIHPASFDVSPYFGLIYPGFSVSTPEAYRVFDQMQYVKPPLSDYFINDLKQPVFSFNPMLGELEAFLLTQGIDSVYMTGSGSTLFFSSDRLEAISHALSQVSEVFPGVTALLASPVDCGMKRV